MRNGGGKGKVRGVGSEGCCGIWGEHEHEGEGSMEWSDMQSQVREKAVNVQMGRERQREGVVRVLCVGEGKLLAAIDEAGGKRADVVCVGNYMMAMGELAVREVDVVIGPVSRLKLAAGAIAKGIRRLAPNAKLVLIEDEEGEAVSEAIAGGFDIAVNWPVDLSVVNAVMMGMVTNRKIEDEEIERFAVEDEEGEDAKTGETEEREMAEQVAAMVSDRSVLDDASNEEIVDDASNEEIVDEVENEVELGDVDLVDSILDGAGMLRRTAIELVKQQSGIKEIGWVKPAGDVPVGHVSMAIEYRGRLYGILHAPEPVKEHELAVWSGWLCRWLALDDQVRQLKNQAMKDELTGAWNRRYFNRFLDRIMMRAREDRSQVTVMVFDIDDFKQYNDKYGHAAGDEILAETAKMMQSVVREHDVVARIGGDEFAVIFWDAEGPRKANSRHPQDVMMAAKRFQKAVSEHKFPKLAGDAMGKLTISGGLASYPWDGRDSEEIVEKADMMAFESKRAGKNAITFGRGVRQL